MIFEQNISLKDKNWFAIGGPARYYCQPVTALDFQEALLCAQKQNLALFFLGSGANILISDTGFNGLVIHPKNSPIMLIDHDQGLIQASAGTTMEELIIFALDHNLTGLEVFSN